MSQSVKRARLPRRTNVALNTSANASVSRKGNQNELSELPIAKRRADNLSDRHIDTDELGITENLPNRSIGDAASEALPLCSEESTQEPPKKRHQSHRQRRVNEEANYRSLRPHAHDMLTREGEHTFPSPAMHYLYEFDALCGCEHGRIWNYQAWHLHKCDYACFQMPRRLFSTRRPAAWRCPRPAGRTLRKPLPAAAVVRFLKARSLRFTRRSSL
jgi:hypothetical protein